MASATPLLYTYFRSSCSWRVRIALALKGIEYESHAVNLLSGQQLSEEHVRVNPMGEVPALHIDGTLLTQSLAILEYLDETRPEVPLLPRGDALKRAKVRQISQVIASGIQPVQNLSVLKKHGMEHKTEWAQWAINKGFKALEALLAESAGTYCVGDEITMADLCLVPQVYNALRFEVDMAPYPVIARVNAALAEHPAFKAAHPSSQADCPPDLK